MTLLQVDSEIDARALPRTLLSSHATQMMVVRATRIRTTSRGDAETIWQPAISDVNATKVPNEQDPEQFNTRVETKTFYREQISATVSKGLTDLIADGVDDNAKKMGLAIAARLREEHVLAPDPFANATPERS